MDPTRQQQQWACRAVGRLRWTGFHSCCRLPHAEGGVGSESGQIKPGLSRSALSQGSAASPFGDVVDVWVYKHRF